jgi:hypothetical protein
MPLIQTQEAGAGRLGLHNDSHISQELSEARRDAPQRARNHSVEIAFREHAYVL